MDHDQPAPVCTKVAGSILERHGDFIKANAIIASLALIFFARSILLGLVPSASDILTVWPIFELGHTQVQNILLSDVVVIAEPWMFFNHLNIQNFQLPLWNPYCAGGVPHFANGFFSLFFFMSWPIYILGVTKYTLLIYYFLKIYLAGVCCFLYLRSIGLKFFPAITGSMAYMFMGFNIVWLYYTPSNLVFILPAMLYLIEKVVASRSNEKYFVALTILTATGIFAGFPVMFFHIAVVSFLYLIYKLLSSSLEDAAWVMKRYLLFSALGFMLSAVQLVPFLEYLLNSNAWVVRQGASVMLDWHAAILNLQPQFYGSPSIYQMVPYYVNFTNYNESTSGYVGIAMICLAVFAVMTKFKDSLIRFFLILSIWAIGVVYGLPGIFDLTVSLPLFSKADNFRLLFLIGFNVVVLGSLGLNQIIDWSKQTERGRIMRYFSISASLVLATLFCFAWANRSFLYILSTLNVQQQWPRIVFAQNILVLCTTIVVLILSALIYIYVRFNDNCKYRTASLVLLFVLVFAETGFHGMLFNPAVDEKYFHPKVEVFDWINLRNEQYRTTSISSTGSMSVYPANTQMTYGIYDIRNYDALENRYYWKLLNTFSQGIMIGGMDLWEIDDRFLNFMGVKWIFSDSNLSQDTDVRILHNIIDPIGELREGLIVDQEFLSKKDNLSGIDLFFATYGHNGVESNVTVNLIDTKSNSTIRTAKIDTRVIEEHKWYAVEFDPIKDSSNKSYMMEIKGDGKPGDSVTIFMNRSQTSPSEGETLYLNGGAVQGNLCFNLIYKAKSKFKLIEKRPNYSLFENLAVFPRAFIVHNASFENDDEKILNALEDPSNDWRSSIIIYGEGKAVAFPEGRSEANITKYDYDYVKIDAFTEHPGFLVLSDAYYPGWNAYVNGSRVDIFRANYAFRAVKTPSGKSVVEFRYEPMSLFIGTVMTSISVIIIIIIISILIRRKSRAY